MEAIAALTVLSLHLCRVPRVPLARPDPEAHPESRSVVLGDVCAHAVIHIVAALQGASGPPGDNGRPGSEGRKGFRGRDGSPGTPGDPGLEVRSSSGNCHMKLFYFDSPPPSSETHPAHTRRAIQGPRDLRGDVATLESRCGENCCLGSCGL